MELETPLLRPQGGRGVLSWTPGMAAIEQQMRKRALVTSVLSGRREVSPAMVVAALGRRCRVPSEDVRIEVTRPSDFLISFRREEDCASVLGWSGRFSVEGASISFRHWHRSVHARRSKLLFVVKLAVEGLPAHALEFEAIKQFLNKIDCQFIELFLPVDACMTEVLAWSVDPSKIPKEFTLDIPEPMQEWWMPPVMEDPDIHEPLVSQTPPAPPIEKRCLSFDLLIHVLEVVDPVQQLLDSPPDDPYNDDREALRRCAYGTFLGRIDGTGPVSLWAVVIVSRGRGRERLGVSNDSGPLSHV